MNTQNPIEAAVLPLKSDAVTRAEQEAREMIDEAIERLEKAAWDLNVVAPRPNGGMKRAEYLHKQSVRSFFESITQAEGNPTMAMALGRATMIVHLWQDGIEQFVTNAKEDAAAEYDAFVAKLTDKIGVCESALLLGNHVWSHSLLTVEKRGGVTEQWKTRMIVNRSCLGKLFNQFPTRKTK